ncbi:MAG: long-chain-fatty-acid--CoA ligase [Paracoccaceae bacterium]|nr:MAG: long-chain-fatty-acid--CoA ligase [Paracoccaceae bacterium]
MTGASDSGMRLDSFPRLLRRNATRFGSSPSYREKEFGIWQTETWAETHARVRDLAVGLAAMGLARGEHAAIIGTNRPDLYRAMVAIQSVGAIPVPLYQDSVAEEMAYVLDHCGATFVIAEDQEQVDKVLEVADRLPALRKILYLDPRGLRKYDHTNLHPLREVMEAGRRADPRFAAMVDEAIEAATGSDTCVMLYTSGTTGRPKGVVLTNDNIIFAARASSEFDRLTRDEVVLAYLPMAWVGDFIFSMGQAYWCGFCVCCPESPETMQSDMREIGPTYFFAPPRVFEQMLTSVMIRMEDAGPVKRWLFDRCMAVARRVGPRLLDGRPVALIDRIAYAIGDVLIYGPLKNVLGLSRVRVGYTAGEAIGPEIFEFYRSLGINLKQLYGQTEASVFITQQPDGEVRADTVGVASPGVEIRIGENGEVYYRSPGVFREYFRSPEATAAAKDAEGWVATGDAGFIDRESGHLRIIDRAKDVGRLADGSLFAPKYVENKLKFYPNILEAVVFGAGRDHCVAIINIDLAAVGNWAERNNIAYASYQELSQHPKVLDMIQAHVEAVNREPRRRRDALGLPDPPLPDPAQGAGCRRWRTDPHPQGAPADHRAEIRAADRRTLFGCRLGPGRDRGHL